MNETTALALTDEQALAMLAELDDLAPGGMEHVRDEDKAQPPRLKISAQNKPLTFAETEIPAGHIANSMTGEDYGTTVAGVFLRFMSDTRCMWPDAYNADNDPLCYSNDGIVPAVPNEQRPATNPQKGPCESCPFARFGENGEAPKCQRQRNFLVWLVESEEPVLLTVKSTGLKFAKTLTNLAMTCNVKRAIWFSTQKISSDKGAWFVMNYTKGDRIAPQLSLTLHELKQDLAKLVIQADVDDAGAGYTTTTATSDVVEDEIPF